MSADDLDDIDDLDDTLEGDDDDDLNEVDDDDDLDDADDDTDDDDDNDDDDDVGEVDNDNDDSSGVSDDDSPLISTGDQTVITGTRWRISPRGRPGPTSSTAIRETISCSAKMARTSSMAVRIPMPSTGAPVPTCSTVISGTTTCSAGPGRLAPRRSGRRCRQWRDRQRHPQRRCRGRCAHRWCRGDRFIFGAANDADVVTDFNAAEGDLLVFPRCRAGLVSADDLLASAVSDGPAARCCPSATATR